MDRDSYLSIVLLPGRDHHIAIMNQSNTSDTSYYNDYFSDYYEFEFPSDGIAETRNFVTSREVILFVTLTCIVGPINLIGIVTNTLSVVVFQRYPTRGSTTFLLQVLSAADSFFLLNNILYLSVQYYYAQQGRIVDFYRLYGNFLPVLVGFTELSRDYSVWMVVLITVDRFLGICYPLRSPKWCDVRKAALAVCLVLVYCIVFNIPEFMFSQMHEFSGVPNIGPTALGDNFTFNACYFAFDVLLNLLIPICTVMFMNCRICCELVKARRHRLTMTRGNVPRHSRMTTMLIAVAVFFLICQVPRVIGTIYNCHSLYNKHITGSTSLPFVLYAVSNILQNCNSFVNFFIYCFTGKQFRTVLWLVCSCQKARRNSFSTEETRRFSLHSTTCRKISS